MRAIAYRRIALGLYVVTFADGSTVTVTDADDEYVS